jgi:O-antigen ligase
MWNEYGPPGAVHRAIHSIWFQVLGDHGFVGFFLFVLLLFMGWRNLAKIRKASCRDPARRWQYDLAGFMQVSMVAYIVAGSALPMAYFDLTYQLIAFTMLSVFTERGEESGGGDVA